MEYFTFGLGLVKGYPMIKEKSIVPWCLAL
jgi:hypothetical protein